MSFVFLPNEILLMIARHLGTTNDLFSLIRTRSELYHLLIGELYKVNVHEDGGSALVWYARKGDDAGVKNMLAAGADVNVRTLACNQPTALLEAVQGNTPSIVKLLLKRGAAPDMADLRSIRPLALSVHRRNNASITELLLMYGAKSGILPCDKRSILVDAVANNQLCKVSALLKYGADPTISDGRYRRNLLHIAAARNAQPAIIDLLLSSGIQLDSQDQNGNTPLQVAVKYSCTRAVRTLLQHGADPNFNGSIDGFPAIFYAICPPSSRNKTMIQYLVTYGAAVDARGPSGQTALLHAISKGAFDAARVLADCGARIAERTTDGESVLHAAVASPIDLTLEEITRLTESGADVNWAGGSKRETPLFYAIGHAKAIMAEKLISLGASVNFRNADGLTPLSLAASRCFISLSETFIRHGASVNSLDLQNKSPLHHALDAKYASIPAKREMVALLVRSGADVNARDVYGFTPLHRAVSTQWTWEIVSDLLQAGVDRYTLSTDSRFSYDMIPNGL